MTNLLRGRDPETLTRAEIDQIIDECHRLRSVYLRQLFDKGAGHFAQAIKLTVGNIRDNCTVLNTRLQQLRRSLTLDSSGQE
ncbi:MAG: hypothetical protein V7727_21180 [Sneathiella sp.]